MTSIALLGDSIFDNHAYVGQGPDVVTQLRTVLPEGWRATLCARDGTTTADIGPQLDRVPDHVTHVVLSLGGNDGLENADLLAPIPVPHMAAALDRLGERIDAFVQAYGWVLDAVCALGPAVTVCTIYDANLAGDEGHRAITVLRLFNDAIVQAALARDVDVLDLRTVCTQPNHYANDIEPGIEGGARIAEAIAKALGALEGTRTSSLHRASSAGAVAGMRDPNATPFRS